MKSSYASENSQLLAGLNWGNINKGIAAVGHAASTFDSIFGGGGSGGNSSGVSAQYQYRQAIQRQQQIRRQQLRQANKNKWLFPAAIGASVLAIVAVTKATAN